MLDCWENNLITRSITVIAVPECFTELQLSKSVALGALYIYIYIKKTVFTSLVSGSYKESPHRYNTLKLISYNILFRNVPGAGKSKDTSLLQRLS